MTYRKEKISIEYFENGGVFYSEKNDKFYALDELGAEIWKYIDSFEVIEFKQLVMHLLKQYKIDESELSRDLLTYLDTLIEFGALSKIDGD